MIPSRLFTVTFAWLTLASNVGGALAGSLGGSPSGHLAGPSLVQSVKCAKLDGFEICDRRKSRFGEEKQEAFEAGKAAAKLEARHQRVHAINERRKLNHARQERFEAGKAATTGYVCVLRGSCWVPCRSGAVCRRSCFNSRQRCSASL